RAQPGSFFLHGPCWSGNHQLRSRGRMVDTILIVEDEPDVVDLVRYNLRRAGFDVLTALNGPAGLETATQSRPDAIVLDVMLPQMHGTRVRTDLCAANENGC